MTLRQFLNGVRYGSPEGPAVVIDWDNRTVSYRRMPARLVARLERWRLRGGARMTPEEATVFYEDDEDPREVFARFDARRGMHVAPRQIPVTLMQPATDAGHPVEPPSDIAGQVRQGLDYIRSTYGPGATR